MMLTGLSFGGMFALPFCPRSRSRRWSFCARLFRWTVSGCGGTVAPSVQGDIVDYDEMMTGERKEGSYFAAFNFVQKSATGVMILITGWVLQVAGFVPNVEQTQLVQISMVTLYGLSPSFATPLAPSCFLDSRWTQQSINAFAR